MSIIEKGAEWKGEMREWYLKNLWRFRVGRAWGLVLNWSLKIRWSQVWVQKKLSFLCPLDCFVKFWCYITHVGPYFVETRGFGTRYVGEFRNNSNENNPNERTTLMTSWSKDILRFKKKKLFYLFLNLDAWDMRSKLSPKKKIANYFIILHYFNPQPNTSKTNMIKNNWHKIFLVF